MRILIVTAVFVVVLGVIIRFLPSGAGEQETPVQLGEYGTVGAFEFTDHTGEAFSSESLKGKVWLANFVFTSCAAECPILTQRMVEVREKLGPREEVAFVSFSVDPLTDNPQRLSEYAEPYGLDPRWRLLTGDPGKLDEVIKSRILLPVTFDYHERTHILASNFIHSNELVVVDAQGEIRFSTDGMTPGAVDRLTEAMSQLL